MEKKISSKDVVCIKHSHNNCTTIRAGLNCQNAKDKIVDLKDSNYQSETNRFDPVIGNQIKNYQSDDNNNSALELLLPDPSQDKGVLINTQFKPQNELQPMIDPKSIGDALFYFLISATFMYILFVYQDVYFEKLQKINPSNYDSDQQKFVNIEDHTI